MKKFVSAAVSAILAAASVMAFTANAEAPETELYFKARTSSDYTIEDDGTVVISRESLFKDGGLTLTSDVYFSDPSLTCWYIHPIWTVDSDFVSFTEIGDPMYPKTEPMKPYAYAETDEDGNFLTARTCVFSISASLNNAKTAAYFTCKAQNMMGDKLLLIPYGETSDAYPLTDFTIGFNRNIPYGEYEVYFYDKEHATSSGQYTEGAFHVEGEGSVMSVPTLNKLKIRVEGCNYGDIDNDGDFDPLDASMALMAYSCVSTNAPHGLSAEALKACDVDRNDELSPLDASNILSYYSYLSTTDGAMSIHEFIASSRT